MFRDLIDDLENYSSEPDLFLNVPYVPTDEEVIDEILAFAGVGPRDVVYDMGSGDGRILVAAALKYDARGMGVEIDPLRIADAMEYAGLSGVECQVDFIEENFFTADIRPATVVTLYLLDAVNIELRPRLLSELRPGTRVVSHAFNMGDWEADEQRRLKNTRLYKWIIPAAVAGHWVWEGVDDTSYRVDLQQKYQEVSGSVWVNEKPAELLGAQLRGTLLTLDIALPNELPATSSDALSATSSESTAAVRFSLHFTEAGLQAVEEHEV